MGSICNKILIRAFYREHAGFFLFVFLLFFGIVQPSTQLYFHYALIRGILLTPAFMGLVAFAWLLYGLRLRRFVRQTLEAPDAIFLYKLNAQSPSRVMPQCLRVTAALFLPVIGYALIIFAVASTLNPRVAPTAVPAHPATAAPAHPLSAVPAHPLTAALALLTYVAALITFTTLHLRNRLRYPGVAAPAAKPKKSPLRVPYWSILFRFLLAENKAVLAAVKIFSCSLLYLLLRVQTPDDYDLRMPFLAYSLALFGHGILLYRCRRIETTRLLFYPALPVPRIRRFGQSALFTALLLVPETVVLAWVTPRPIRLSDTLNLMILGYAVVLTLYFILKTLNPTIKQYLQLCLALLAALYCLALTIWRIR